MSKYNALAVCIFDQLGANLSNSLDKKSDLIQPKGSLLEQLKSNQDIPNITLETVIDIAEEFFHNLSNYTINPFNIGTSILEDLFDKGEHFFSDLQTQLIAIVSSKNNEQRVASFRVLLQDCKCFSQGLEQIIGNEIGVVLSLATVMRALNGKSINEGLENVPEKVETALMAYFFKSGGYKTIDGSSIVSPIHLCDIFSLPVEVSGDAAKLQASFSHEINQLKNRFSKATAEIYVRDSIEIIVESAYNTARGLEGRYKQVDDYMAGIKPEIENKFVTWFKGFSVLAESSAMRAVEVATRGVSTFQTNALIAAAAGTFAGTVARKLAQDAFLDVLLEDMGR